MSEVFEIKRSKIFYEYKGCQCEDVGDVLSFRGVATGLDYDSRLVEDVIIGFFDYNSNSYCWFYEDFDEFYLNKLEGFNSCEASLDELEEAMNKVMDSRNIFKLTHVAHDYSLFIKRE